MKCAALKYTPSQMKTEKVGGVGDGGGGGWRQFNSAVSLMIAVEVGVVEG